MHVNGNPFLGCAAARVAINLLLVLATSIFSVGVSAGPILLVPSSDGSTSNNGRVLGYVGRTGEFLGTKIQSLPQEIINGLALGADGFLYVSIFNTISNTNGRIDRYELASGQFLDTFIKTGSGGLFSPSELTFGPGGDLFVVNNLPDAGADNLLRFDGVTGNFVSVFAGPLFVPQDLAFGSDGDLYVSNGSKRRVQRSQVRWRDRSVQR